MRKLWSNLTFALATTLLLTACAGPTVLNEDDKAQLRQVNRIRVKVGGDYRTQPPGSDGIWDHVARFVEARVRAAGYSVAEKAEQVDTTISVYIVFVNVQPVGTPSPDYKRGTRYMRTELHIEHARLGRLSRHTNLVESPYQENYVEADTFKWLDKNILISLERLMPPRAIPNSCTRALKRPNNTQVSGGELILELKVSSDGAVTNAQVLRSTGDRSLDAAGIDRVMSCRYSPELIDGRVSPGVGTAIQHMSFPRK
jgi:TonB family protein